MTYRRLPTGLPGLLREAGLNVVARRDWHEKGRPASAGDFDPRGVLIHHTASGPHTPDEQEVRLLEQGRSDLPGPLVQFGVARDGTVYLIAGGRANHAGKAKASGPMPAGDGNELYVGIEMFNDGRGEQYPAIQYDAAAKLAALLLKHMIRVSNVGNVRGHKETSITGKIDPLFSMHFFRERVATHLTGDDVTPQDIEKVADRVVEKLLNTHLRNPNYYPKDTPTASFQTWLTYRLARTDEMREIADRIEDYIREFAADKNEDVKP